MKIFKLLRYTLFIMLMVPVGFMDAIYDIVMFIVEGEDHDFCVMLEWLSDKLLD